VDQLVRLCINLRSARCQEVGTGEARHLMANDQAIEIAIVRGFRAVSGLAHLS
jgi:hypothetical protein